MIDTQSENITASSQASSSFGVNVSGYVSSEFGLGEAVRSTIRGLEAAKIPIVINNLTFDKMHRQQDSSYTNFSTKNPYPINIIHVNGDMTYKFIEAETASYFENKYNIGFWAWELPDFPSAWMSSLYLFNEIWTPSNFCVETISQVSPIPVLKMVHTLDLPPPTIGREHLNLPADKFIFVFMFDFCSVFERKNPIAVVKAFNQAFGNNDQVLLIIKSVNGNKFGEKQKLLKSAVNGATNIKLIDGFWDKQYIHALVYNCDAYVSLHSSEGFGLTMAEAMFYGKPTLGTAYSANVEFMNINNSFPVRYKLKTLDINYGHYKKGSAWAEPDVSHAAELMRYVFDNPEQGRLIGARAALDIKNMLNPQVVGQKFKHRLEHIALIKDNFQNVLQPQDLLPERARFEIELQNKREEIERLHDKIELMKESRFWKIRNQWFKFKNRWRQDSILE